MTIKVVLCQDEDVQLRDGSHVLSLYSSWTKIIRLNFYELLHSVTNLNLLLGLEYWKK